MTGIIELHSVSFRFRDIYIFLSEINYQIELASLADVIFNLATAI